eukprot:symbB.v1.2.009353.t1/scaffold561.1/size520142/21
MADATGKPGCFARIPVPPSSVVPRPSQQRPSCSGRKFVEAKSDGYESSQAGSLRELSDEFQRKCRLRERLHGPALAFSRQSSPGSDWADLEFLFTGSDGSA